MASNIGCELRVAAELIYDRLALRDVGAVNSLNYSTQSESFHYDKVALTSKMLSCQRTRITILDFLIQCEHVTEQRQLHRPHIIIAGEFVNWEFPVGNGRHSLAVGAKPAGARRGAGHSPEVLGGAYLLRGGDTDVDKVYSR